MANTIITLNCLLLPRTSGVERKALTEYSITTLKISTDETVDQLRIMIRERWPSLFEKVPPADFILCKINDIEPKKIHQLISKLMNIVLGKVKREKEWLHMS